MWIFIHRHHHRHTSWRALSISGHRERFQKVRRGHATGRKLQRSDRPEAHVDAAVPVKRGAIGREAPIGHCRFTSFEVSTPGKGEPYASRYAMSSTESGTAAGTEGGKARSGLKPIP